MSKDAGCTQKRASGRGKGWGVEGREVAGGQTNRREDQERMVGIGLIQARWRCMSETPSDSSV